MTVVEKLLIAMTLILAIPYLTWRLLGNDRYLPLVVVQILAGIVLGPGLLGAAFPEVHRFVFAPEVVVALNAIATWAVMLFVWIAGIELDLHDAWADRLATGIAAGLAMLMPVLFGAVAAVLLLWHDPGWMGLSGAPWQFVAGVGMACAVTALPILILFMEKLDILRRPLGQRVLRYASLDDLAIWAVLALILLDFERIGRQGLFLLGFTVAALGIRNLMPRLPETDRWFVALIWLAACGFAADWAGLHFMVGAFLSGVILDGRWFDRDGMDLLRHHLLLTMMPVFFLSTGLRTEWSMGGLSVLLAGALLLASSVAGKLAGVHLAGRILDWGRGEASTIGWLLQTKALIMIIFANILLDRGVIGSEAFTALLLAAVASTMLAVPMATHHLGRIESGTPASAGAPAIGADGRAS